MGHPEGLGGDGTTTTEILTLPDWRPWWGGRGYVAEVGSGDGSIGRYP